MYVLQHMFLFVVHALWTWKIAVGLWLGTSVCGPHQCQHCSAMVDEFGRHALSCRRSEGRHQRHAALNDIMKRALASAHVPSRLEPTGLVRSDGKRPDGVTLAPWKSGRLLVWDATCPDTFAPSYRAHATQESGRVAAAAEERKEEKYRCLPPSHWFTLLSIHGRNWSKVFVIAEGCGVVHSKWERGTSLNWLPAAAALGGSPAGKLCLCAGGHHALNPSLFLLTNLFVNLFWIIWNVIYVDFWQN